MRKRKIFFISTNRADYNIQKKIISTLIKNKKNSVSLIITGTHLSKQFGFTKNCLTGTDRLAEVAKKIVADIYINVQGDEPLVNPNDILKVIDAKKRYPNEIINGYSTIEKK